MELRELELNFQIEKENEDFYEKKFEKRTIEGKKRRHQSKNRH